MPPLITRAAAVLRGNSQQDSLAPPLNVPQMLLFITLFGALYGAAMGTFGGVTGDRLLQIFYSAMKVPLLLLLTFGLSLPSFFIFNSLLGVRGDFPHVLRALLTTQAGLTILLAALAPYTLLWNISTAAHDSAVLFNGVMFALATLGGQLLLRRYYRPLIERDARHLLLLRIWGFVYAFVGIQMGWILRPFIGDPGRPVGLFREDTWGNAYVILFDLIRKVLKI